MGAQHSDERREQAGTTVKRRGILAAAGAVVAGLVAMQTSEPVAAAVSTADAFVANGTANTGVDTGGGTFITGVLGRGSLQGVLGLGNGAGTFGVQGNGGATGTGVSGNGATGLLGTAIGSNGIGVQGTANVPSGIGVKGESASGVGVQGNSSSSVGVQGISQMSYGVAGYSGGVGVYGLSSGSYGIVGITTAGSPYSGITGGASVAGAAAFAGGATGGAFAAYFTGPVVVDGAFTVIDPANKHGAIKHPDGSYRLLYSMESPESWVEDFGTGQLTGGKAAVALDKDFAAIAQTDMYHVFLTPLGDSKGLYATTRTATGFAVREQQGGTSGIGFSWRVVARPNGQGKGERLGKFTVPNIKVPTVNDLPKMPETTPAPPVPRKP
jgi:hypothetical protein